MHEKNQICSAEDGNNVAGAALRWSAKFPESPDMARCALNLLAYLGQDFDTIPREELKALHEVFNGGFACVANSCYQTEDLSLWKIYRNWIVNR